jgi:hypothetical protein
LFWDVDITPEEEDEIVKKIAKKIHEYNIDIPSILLLEGIKPLTFVGSQIGRFTVSPFLSLLGDDVGLMGEKILRVFEKRENLEKIQVYLEELEKKKKEEKKLRKKDKRDQKHGIRRFLPF